MEGSIAVREKTIEDRIRELANPELCKSGDEAEKIIQMLSSERLRYSTNWHNQEERLRREIDRLQTEIRALTGYIQFKELVER